MIAVSSHKPNCALHHSAKKTWDRAFDYVIYLGPPDPALAGPLTAFVPAEPFPRIFEAVKFCAGQPGWSAIINADIHVADNFRGLETYLFSKDKLAAVSGRYQFDPPFDMKALNGTIDDLGLDFFAADQAVWIKVEREIPKMFRFGHIIWDTWMLGFFIACCQFGMADLTPWKTIYHPRHSRGKAPYAIDSKYRDDYTKKAMWPLTQYTL